MISNSGTKTLKRLARNYLSLKGIPPYMGNLGMLRERLTSLKESDALESNASLTRSRELQKLILEQLAYFHDLAYSNRFGDNYAALQHEIEKSIEDGLMATLEKGVMYYNAEELIAFLEVTRPVKKTENYSTHVINRFCRLLERHLEENSAGFETTGNQISVTMRTLETHSFARLVHLIFFLRDKLSAEQVEKLRPLIDTYLYKEVKNISLDDHMLVLSSLLNYMEPYEVHSEFLQTRLPVAKVTNCSTFVLMTDLLVNLSFLPKAGQMLNEPQTFKSALKFLESQIPYICDWPNPELSSYIIAAAVSVSRSHFKVSEPVWDVIQEGFFYFIQSFNSKQKILYLQAALDSGLMLTSGPNSEEIMRPIQEDLLAELEPSNIDEIVSLLSILKRTNHKANEALIVRSLAELDSKVNDAFVSKLAKNTARRLALLVDDGKAYRHFTKQRLLAVAGNN